MAKENNKKLIIWTVVALIVGIIIGLLITNLVTTGNARFIIKNKGVRLSEGDKLTLSEGLELKFENGTKIGRFESGKFIINKEGAIIENGNDVVSIRDTSGGGTEVFITCKCCRLESEELTSTGCMISNFPAPGGQSTFCLNTECGEGLCVMQMSVKRGLVDTGSAAN